MPEGTDTSTANNSGTVNNTDAATVADNKRKFEFDEAEQKFIQGIIDKSVGKVHGQYKAQVESLQSQLDEINKGSNKGGKETVVADTAEVKDEKEKQFKTLLDNEKNKTKNAELIAQQRDKELKEARDEALRIRKEVAIQRAAAKQNFYELDVVMAMTQGNIEFDDESKSFVVKENGIVKQNSSLQPMSLEEYFSSFAAQRPYLVNGDMVSGAGSVENKGTNTGAPVVLAKSDMKNAKEKSDFITKFGLQKFEDLPYKR